ncbi:MAG: hypothetical protein ABSB79_03960 [Syntrophales bacterium]|jgi:hypothetical protein
MVLNCDEHAASEILLDDVAITAALQESGIAAHHIPSALNTARKIQPDAADLIDRFIQRVELQQDGIRLTLSLASLMVPEMDSNAVNIIRDIPMQIKRRGVEMRLIIGGTGPARVDQRLLKTIVRAHKWFNDLVSGQVHNMAEIVSQEGIDKSYVSRVMYLAFLAPDITESILAGRQPADLSVEKLLNGLIYLWTGRSSISSWVSSDPLSGPTKYRTEKIANIKALTCFRLTSPVNSTSRTTPTASLRAHRPQNLSCRGNAGGCTGIEPATNGLKDEI